MRFAACLIVAIAVTGGAGQALAADPVLVAMESTAMAVPAGGHAFDWNGFYAGVFGGAGQSFGDGTQFGLGLNVGVNAQFDFVLVGAEVALQGSSSDTIETTYGEVLGRGGLVLTDDVMLYAAAGYGWDFGGGNSGALAGGGVEMALTDDVTLRAQYLRSFDEGPAAPTDQVTFGAAFHF